MADPVHLLKFPEAEALGVECHDRMVAMGVPPVLERDDLGWADLVQFVLRRARDIADAKRAAGEE